MPLSDFTFAIPGLPNRKAVTWENGVGLIFIMGGLVIYRFYARIAEKFPFVKRFGDALQCWASPQDRLVSEAELSGGMRVGLLEGDPLALDETTSSSPSASTPIRGTLLHVQTQRRAGAGKAGHPTSGAAKTKEAPY